VLNQGAGDRIGPVQRIDRGHDLALKPWKSIQARSDEHIARQTAGKIEVYVHSPKTTSYAIGQNIARMLKYE